MSKSLLLSLPARVGPIAASTFAHATLALVVVGGHVEAGHESQRSESAIAVDILDAVALPTPATDAPAKSEKHDHVFPNHTHPYPVSPDHDAHPHDPSIDHRLALRSAAVPPAAASDALVAGDVPRFFISLGVAKTASGGATSAAGEGSRPGTGASATSSEPVPEAWISEPAHLLTGVAPLYPASARANGIEADVVLELLVNADGRVADVRVVGQAEPGFDAAACDAVRRYRFSPAQRNGHAVRVRMRWTVQFRLE